MPTAVLVYVVVMLGTVGGSFPPAGWKTDRYGDPLPPGAVARLGSARLRHVGLLDWTFPPGGRTVITVGRDHTTRTWEVVSGKPIAAVPLEGGNKLGPGDQAVALSADGRWVAAETGRGVGVWDARSGSLVRRFPLPEPVDTVRFTSDGRRVLVVLRDGSVYLLDRPAGLARQVLGPDRIRVNSPTHGYVTPDGAIVVAGGNQFAAVDVADVATGRVRYRLRDVNATAPSPDGGRMALCGRAPDTPAATVWVVDVRTGAEVARLPGSEGYDETVAWSPDGQALALSGQDGGRVVEARTGRVLCSVAGPARCLRFSPDGRLLAATAGPRLRVWDATGTELHPSRGGFGVDHPLRLAGSAGGRYLLAPDEKADAVAVWDLADGRVARRFRLPDLDDVRGGLAVGARGRAVVAVTSRGVSWAWPTSGGPATSRVEMAGGPRHPFVRPLFPYLSADGRRYVVPSRGTAEDAEAVVVTAWDVRTGAVASARAVPRGVDPTIHALSTDGATAVLGWEVGGTTPYGLFAVDVGSGRVRAWVPAEAFDTYRAAVSADGRLVAGHHVDSRRVAARVGVLEAATGREVASLPPGEVQQVGFAAGGRVLVVAGDDELRAYDLATGAERVRRPYPAGRRGQWSRFRDLFVPSDRQVAVTVLGDGTAVVWDVSPAWPMARPPVSPGELAGWWADLGAADAGRGYRAVWAMAAAPPGQVVPFLHRAVRPPAGPVPAVVARLVAELDAPAFADREAAQKGLAELGRAVAPAVRRALARSASAEARARLDAVLARVDPFPQIVGDVRVIRAVAVLEQVGTRGARVLLEELAAGATGTGGADERDAARAALARLAAQGEVDDRDR